MSVPPMASGLNHWWRGRKMSVTRRGIQVALGWLWLLDGVLQLQRQMFTTNFANQVIYPAADGQPAIISAPIHAAAHLILMHPALYNVCFALIQLGLGAAILWKRTNRYGLIGSVVWGLAIWYIGEGLGGLLSGDALLLTGGPGAALLYAVIALGVMSRPVDKNEAEKRPAAWLTIVWAVLWTGGTLLQLVSGQATAGSVSSAIADNATGAPHWLAALELPVSRWLDRGGLGVVVALLMIQVGVGILVLLPSRRWRTLAVSAGIALAFAYWLVGQNLGEYYTGLATDPNTGPLMILLGIAVLDSAAPSIIHPFWLKRTKLVRSS